MAIRDLIPWNRQDSESRFPLAAQDRGDSPLFALHREVNRLFDDMFRGWNAAMPAGAGRWNWPSVEVTEKDNAIRVTAELPGLTERDVELSIDDDALTLRGERRQESEEPERGYSERFYGRFERRIALPSGVETDKVSATFRDGVLTVTVPRAAESDTRRRIPINAETMH